MSARQSSSQWPPCTRLRCFFRYRLPSTRGAFGDIRCRPRRPRAYSAGSCSTARARMSTVRPLPPARANSYPPNPLRSSRAWRVPRTRPRNRAEYSGLSVLDAMSSPLSHAVANVMKRASVITAAMVYQAKPVTPLHVCGVALSVFGAVGYQHLDMCDSSLAADASGTSAPYELVPLQPNGGGGARRGAACKGGGLPGEAETIPSDSNSSASSSPNGSPPPTPPPPR